MKVTIKLFVSGQVQTVCHEGIKEVIDHPDCIELVTRDPQIKSFTYFKKLIVAVIEDYKEP